MAPTSADPPLTVMRQTIARAFSREGVGVHTGAPCTVLVEPATGGGLLFRSPGRREVPARLAMVGGVRGMTLLRTGQMAVGMVEHLLAALYAAGVTDAVATVWGPEVPVLDGSARPWVEGIDSVGLRPLGERLPITISEVVRVEVDGGWAEVHPCGRCEVAVTVDFGPALRGTAEVVLDRDRFRDEVSWARTFAMERDVERLQAAGRGQGASLDNTVVVRDDGSVLNPEGMRGADECVRHKLLDAIGDLALVGAPVHARLVVHKGSHRLHHAVLAKAFGGAR